MESPLISLNLPVLPGSSVSFPHLPTINTLPHIPFQICLYNSYIFFIAQDVLLFLMHFPVFKSHLPEFHCIFHRSPDLHQDVSFQIFLYVSRCPFICGNLPVSPPDLSVSPYISLYPVSPSDFSVSFIDLTVSP
jgi:hypothetical protein